MSRGTMLLALAATLALLIVADGLRYRRLRSLLRIWHVAPSPWVQRASTAVYGLAVILVAVAAAAGSAASTGTAPSHPSASDGPVVLLVLDVSRSMTVRDVAPDRAAVARRAALRLGTSPRVGKVGLVAFARDAYLLVPPTSDRDLLTMYLDALDADVVSGQGSNLARALDVARDALVPGASVAPGPAGRVSMVVLSDGEGFESDDSLEAATQRARRAGIVIHTVTVGTRDGGRVPDVPGARSSARPDVLAQVARATGGSAVTTPGGGSVEGLEASLGRRARQPARAARSGSARAAAWLSLLALGLLLVDGGLERRASGRTS